MTNHPIERETHPMVIAAAKALTGHFAPIEYDHLPADKQALRRLQRQPHGLGIDVSKDDMLEAARAALSALRDLTPDVVEAGCNAIENADTVYPEDAKPFFNAHWEGEARDCFTAMLNTIIGERG